MPAQHHLPQEPLKTGFLSLPTEIRLQVYNLLPLRKRRAIDILARNRRRGSISIIWPRHRGKGFRSSATPFALACTCRFLYNEVAPLYYENVTYLAFSNQWYSIGLWLEAVRRWLGTCIAKIHVLYSESWGHGPSLWRSQLVEVKESGDLVGAPKTWAKKIEWSRIARNENKDGSQSQRTKRQGIKKARRKTKKDEKLKISKNLGREESHGLAGQITSSFDVRQAADNGFQPTIVWQLVDRLIKQG